MRYSLALQATDKVFCAFELLLQISDSIIHGLQIVLPLAVRSLVEGRDDISCSWQHKNKKRFQCNYLQMGMRSDERNVLDSEGRVGSRCRGGIRGR